MKTGPDKSGSTDTRPRRDIWLRTTAIRRSETLNFKHTKAYFQLFLSLSMSISLSLDTETVLTGGSSCEKEPHTQVEKDNIPPKLSNLQRDVKYSHMLKW